MNTASHFKLVTDETRMCICAEQLKGRKVQLQMPAKPQETNTMNRQ